MNKRTKIQEKIRYSQNNIFSKPDTCTTNWYLIISSTAGAQNIKSAHKTKYITQAIITMTTLYKIMPACSNYQHTDKEQSKQKQHSMTINSLTSVKMLLTGKSVKAIPVEWERVLLKHCFKSFSQIINQMFVWAKLYYLAIFLPIATWRVVLCSLLFIILKSVPRLWPFFV